ncbi:MAG: BatA domain-containing protein, partial [Candidatus Brocadiales bacterium]
MSFINPIFLLGLLGITLPIIIHMMGRRRAPTYKFSAIEFILRSQKKVAARLKLEQLLLLLLRVALLALIATALAKPVLTAGPVLAPDTPSCNIIIMDNSYSMGYVIAGKTLLERAKGWAKDFVGTLSPADEGCVITIFPAAEAPPRATADKSDIVDAIDRVAQSYYNTDLPPLLDSALSILNASTKRIKRILLFTDLTKNGWASEGILEVQKRLKDSRARLHLIDISEGKPLPNVAVSGLEHEYDWTRKDKELLLKATISNYTDVPVKDFLVKARIGEEDVAQGFVQIEPGRSATKEFLLDASA